jgi:hypothetical protein
MKSSSGSEVLLRVETLSEDSFATTDSLWALDHTGLPSDVSLQLYTELEHGDYKGQIELSPPATYPSTMGNEANECSF